MASDSDKPSSSSFSLPSLSTISNLKEDSEKKWTEAVKSASDKAAEVVDSGISAVSNVVRSTTATVSQEAEKAYSQAQDMYGIGKAHYEQTEEQVVSKLREGVNFILEHKDESVAAGVVAALVLLPGARRFLYRHTLGRLRSEEALYKSAELRASTLADRVEGQQKELQRLQEQLAAAQVLQQQDEYQRGLSKLKSTASQLRSLSKHVESNEKSAAALIQDLRSLPSKAALQLRADVAQARSVAASQRSEVEKMVIRLAKQGV